MSCVSIILTIANYRNWLDALLPFSIFDFSIFLRISSNQVAKYFAYIPVLQFFVKSVNFFKFLHRKISNNCFYHTVHQRKQVKLLFFLYLLFFAINLMQKN